MRYIDDGEDDAVEADAEAELSIPTADKIVAPLDDRSTLEQDIERLRQTAKEIRDAALASDPKKVLAGARKGHKELNDIEAKVI